MAVFFPYVHLEASAADGLSAFRLHRPTTRTDKLMCRQRELVPFALSLMRGMERYMYNTP